MGKRKRATKPPPKKKAAKMETIFNCPFCSHESCVYCHIDRGTGIGKVECRVCGVTHESSVNKLEEEIDVYSNWIDACVEANEPGDTKTSSADWKASEPKSRATASVFDD